MLRRCLFMVLGFLSLLFGAVGILLPILPTTPFVLLAAILFSSSSPAMAKKLERNRVFGPYISHYRNKSGVPLAIKKEGLAWLWGSLTISVLIVRELRVALILLVVGIAVSAHILMLKSPSASTASRKQYQSSNTQNHQQ